MIFLVGEKMEESRGKQKFWESEMELWFETVLDEKKIPFFFFKFFFPLYNFFIKI